MVKYVNETGTQIKQKHIDPYKLRGSQTDPAYLSVYPAVIIVMSFIYLGKVTLTKGMNV
jgi:hypothetical protein